MKKAAITILAIVSILVFSVNSFATNGRLSASSVTGKAGDIVNVSISLSDNPGIIALMAAVEYDTATLELVSVKDTELFGKGTALFSNDYKKTPFIITVEDPLCTSDHKENGAIAVLSFKIKNGANGTVPIRLTVDNKSVFDCELNPVRISSQNGNVTVSSDVKPSSKASKAVTLSTEKQTSAKSEKESSTLPIAPKATEKTSESISSASKTAQTTKVVQTSKSATDSAGPSVFSLNNNTTKNTEKSVTNPKGNTETVIQNDNTAAVIENGLSDNGISAETTASQVTRNPAVWDNNSSKGLLITVCAAVLAIAAAAIALKSRKSKNEK